MTEVLEQTIVQTDKVFNSDGLVIPEPSLDWKRKLDALEEAGLPRQKSALIYQMRIWQAEQLGFKRMTPDEAVVTLMGCCSYAF